MKNKNLWIVTTLSLLACIAHGVMLFTPFNDYTYTSAAKLMLFVATPIIYFALSKDGKFKDMFRVEKGTKAIKYSLLFGLATFVVVLLLFIIIRPWLDGEMIINAMSNVGITRENYIFAAMYYIVVNVALEELFFRGFIFLTLYKMGYRAYAHVFSALLFAIYHVAIMQHGVDTGILLLATGGLVAVGFLFNEITRRCNNVFGSYIVHFSASLAIVIAGFYFL